MNDTEQLTELANTMSGGTHHALLEWTALIAIFATIALAIAHYANSKDRTVAVFGVAFFFLGIMEAFHTLSAMRLLGTNIDYHNLNPYTWALARGFSAIALLCCVIVSLRERSMGSASSKRLTILLSVIFGSAAFLLIRHTMSSEQLPQTQFPNALVTRPYDAIPLILYI
ncbi:MAG: histidine kinase, partial [Gammaproteobacteria bacterium]|nr:histidine kinase [Gammaproteobacteria bacterium]